MASGKIEWSLGLDASGFHRAVNGAKSAIQGGFKDMLAPIAKVTAALGSVAGVMQGIKGGVDLGSEMQELSARTGVAVQDLFMMRKIFKDTGVDASKLGPAINTMQKALASAVSGGSEGNVLKALGLDPQALASMDSGKAFEAIGARIAQLPNSVERASAAMQIFGKSGGELLQVFMDPAFKDAGNLSNTAKILGQNAASFSEASNALGHAGGKLQGFFVGMNSQFVPLLHNAIQEFEKLDLSGIGSGLGAVIGNFMTNWRAASKVLLSDLSQVIGVALSGDGIKLFCLELLNAAALFGNAFLEAFRVPLEYFGATIEKRVNQIHDALGVGRLSKSQVQEMGKQMLSLTEKGVNATNKSHELRNAAFAPGVDREKRDAMLAEADRQAELGAKYQKLSGEIQSQINNNGKLDTKSIEEIIAENRKGGTSVVDENLAKNKAERAVLGNEIADLRSKVAAAAAGIKFGSFTPTELTNKANEKGRSEAAKNAPKPGSNAEFDAEFDQTKKKKEPPGQIIADSFAKVGGGGYSVFLGLGDVQRQQLAAQQQANQAHQQTNQLLQQVVTRIVGAPPVGHAHASP